MHFQENNPNLFFLRMFLMKQKIYINFIKCQLMRTYLLINQCDKMSNMYKIPFTYQRIMVSWGKVFCLVPLCDLKAKLSYFLIEHHFYLKKMTDKLWLFRLGYVKNIFEKWKSAYNFKEKIQLIVFVTHKNNCTLKRTLKFRKTYLKS